MVGHRNHESGRRFSTPSQWRLGPLTRQDLERLLRIEHRCFEHPWSRQSFDAIITEKTFFSLGAFSQKTLAGYLIWSEAADELHILNIAVDPSFRNQGVASLLLEEVHQGAYKNGRRFSFLEVRESNESAQRVYERKGYRKVTKRLNYYEGDQEDAILMMAKLKKSKK